MHLLDYASPFASSTLMLIMALFGGHAIADYGWQSPFMAEKKVRGSNPDWFVTLGAHVLIHGFVVLAITGSAVLGLAEAVLHFAIDDAKSRNLTSYRTDQALHYLCKLLWVAIMLAALN